MVQETSHTSALGDPYSKQNHLTLILILWEPFHNLITHSLKSTIFVFKPAVQSFNWLPLVPVLLEIVNNHFLFMFYAPTRFIDLYRSPPQPSVF